MDRMTFPEAMLLTRTVSSNAAFEDPECQAYYEILSQLPENSLIVEVGLQFGRSSSIALQAAKAGGLRYHGIDPFVDPPEAYDAWMKVAAGIGVRFRLSRKRSRDVIIGEPVACLLIDGDHSYEAVKSDLEHFAPRVTGYVLCHDYGRESLPEVLDAVNEYFALKARRWPVGYPYTWEQLPTIGTLGRFKRL